MKKNLWLAAGSAVVTLALSLLAVEVYLRLTKPPGTPAAIRARSLEYTATLFARHAFPTRQRRVDDWKFTGRPLTISSRGYRAPAFQPRKAPGTTRLIITGGSAAFDSGAPDGLDWPALLGRRLRSRTARPVEVVNAAIPGHATFDSFGRYLSELWMFEPDLVLVYHGWNDLKDFHWLDPDSSLLRGQRPSPVRDGTYTVDNPFIYSRNLLDAVLGVSELYGRLRYRYLTVKLGRVSLEGTLFGTDERFQHDTTSRVNLWGLRQLALTLHAFVTAVERSGARTILVTQPRLAAETNGPEERSRIRYAYVRMGPAGLLNAFAAVDSVVREVARSTDSYLIDAAPVMSGRPRYFTDHVHTTPEGSTALARLVGQCLERWLGPDPTGERVCRPIFEAAEPSSR